MYLLELLRHCGSTRARTWFRRECDGCEGSRRMRIVLRPARIAVSRRGSLRIVRFVDDEGERRGESYAANAATRSPLPCAMTPAAYSMRQDIDSGSALPSSSEELRSSFND